jgi:hypothetical protein
MFITHVAISVIVGDVIYIDSSICNSADLTAAFKLVLSTKLDKFDRQYE